MNILLVFPGYFLWHYTFAFRDIWHVWGNLLWFVAKQFSILLLLKSLFSPWRRVVENGPRHFDLEAWAGAVVVNLMSRLVGAMMRLIMISVGIITLSGVVVGGILFFALWIVAPFLVTALFLLGFYFII